VIYHNVIEMALRGLTMTSYSFCCTTIDMIFHVSLSSRCSTTFSDVEIFAGD